jgi:serine/threonine-protein kinase HipA
MNKCLYCYKELKEDKDFHAKCSKVFFGSDEILELKYSLAEMNSLAKEVVNRSVTVPGVQAKLSMGLVEEVQKKGKYRLTIVGELGGKYIFKPPTVDYPEMPENEHLTMRIAELLGVDVVPSSLIRLKSGELAYITKRIDRTTDGAKIHMLDMYQITEAFDKYRSSMEKVAKAVNQYSDNTLLDKLRLFELLLFSFLTGNNDMHLKNFSMIKSGEKWVLSPAYDLLNVAVLLPEDTEALALTLAGKKKKITWELFEGFGLNIGLNKKQINAVRKRFNLGKEGVYDLIEQSFLSKEMRNKYILLMDSRYSRLLSTR